MNKLILFVANLSFKAGILVGLLLGFAIATFAALVTQILSR